ncbi:MAG TPA: hypothetical protein VFA52_02780 [Candidatus Paceibacterota bacterium]|nr:hypothetical protein [Candidatus Paceibacterota bacterium]
MNTHDLAWRGTTPIQKQRLFISSLKERDELIRKGKHKEAHLQLVSTCHDIINTAKAALKMTDNKILRSKWQNLLEQAKVDGEQSLISAIMLPKDDWQASDFEVAAVGLMDIVVEPGNPDDANKASALLDEGLKRAKGKNKAGARLLLLSQQIRAMIIASDLPFVRSSLYNLEKILNRTRMTDNKILTRVHRAIAEGHKFLAIKHAESDGLENQRLKALNI